MLYRYRSRTVCVAVWWPHTGLAIHALAVLRLHVSMLASSQAAGRKGLAASCTRPSHDLGRVATCMQELAAFAPGRCWRLIEVDATLEDVERLHPHLLGQCPSMLRHHAARWWAQA